MTINDKYQFRLRIGDKGYSFRVFCINETLEFETKRVPGTMFYRVELKTKLRFTDGSPRGGSRYDDDLFKAIYDVERARRNEIMDIQLVRNDVYGGVDNGPFRWYHGKFTTGDCRFDVDNCIVDVTPNIYDPMVEVQLNWETDHDLYQLVEKTKVSTYQGVIQRKRCDSIDAPAQCDWVDSTWSLLRRSIVYNIVEEDQSGEETIYDRYTDVYVREFFAGADPPEGDDWIVVEGGYARPVDVEPYQIIDLENQRYQETNILVSPEFSTEGFSLLDVVEGLLGHPVKSEYFRSTGAITNKYYDYAAIHYQNLLLAHISDVAYPDADEPASRMLANLKDILNDLEAMFGVYLSYENSEFVLEHLSYYQSKFNLNFTEPHLKKWIEGFWKYEIDSSSLPKEETWIWPVSNEGAVTDFYADTIKYQNINPEADTTSYSVKKIVTDIRYFDDNEEFRDNTELLVMISRGDDGVIKESGFLTGNIGANNSLSWANLINYCHTYRRPFREGTLKGLGGEKPISIEKRNFIKEQDEFKFRLKDEDVSAYLDGADRMRTQLGWGIVDTMTLEEPSGLISIKLKHD